MPNLSFPSKLKPFLTKKKRFKVLIGGRGSAKSTSIADIMLLKMETEGADILCLRELQNSIDDSVHKLFKSRIDKSNSNNRFYITDNKIVSTVTKAETKYKGAARNPDAIKSAEGFKYSWVEEAQTISEETLEHLLPTIRATDSELWFSANPRSSADPFSKRFIIPYLSDLEANGYYEDDLHMIAVINWRDNPFFPKELEDQRQFDYQNMSRAKYDHIWEGKFNDTVERAIIYPEWFDACVDAHIKLGIEPKGIEVIAHDPSDLGEDAKGLAYRHGIVIKDVLEKTDGDINEGGDWASSYSVNIKPDYFIWDCDGMGVGLNRQFKDQLEIKNIKLIMYKGSNAPRDPKAVFEKVGDKVKTNDEALLNTRAQAYWELRERMRKTYDAVVHGRYENPDDLISISKDIVLINSLRSELCRIPTVENGSGRIQIMTKKEMKKNKIKSPNLADAVAMAMFCRPEIKKKVDVNIQPIYSPFARR